MTRPFRAEIVIVATYSLAAMADLLPVAGFGQRAVVGEAHFAPDLDLIERIGLVSMSVPMDDERMDATAAIEQMDRRARVKAV